MLLLRRALVASPHVMMVLHAGVSVEATVKKDPSVVADSTSPPPSTSLVAVAPVTTVALREVSTTVKDDEGAATEGVGCGEEVFPAGGGGGEGEGEGEGAATEPPPPAVVSIPPPSRALSPLGEELSRADADGGLGRGDELLARTDGGWGSASSFSPTRACGEAAEEGRVAVTDAAFVGVGGFAIVSNLGEAEEVAAVGASLVLVVMHKPKSSSSADMRIL